MQCQALLPWSDTARASQWEVVVICIVVVVVLVIVQGAIVGAAGY